MRPAESHPQKEWRITVLLPLEEAACLFRDPVFDILVLRQDIDNGRVVLLVLGLLALIVESCVSAGVSAIQPGGYFFLRSQPNDGSAGGLSSF